jgi:hypothetical protein
MICVSRCRAAHPTLDVPNARVIIQEIKIKRCFSIDAVPQADITNMHLCLRVVVENAKEDSRFHVRFSKLGAIIDDRGKLLSTKERLQGIPLDQELPRLGVRRADNGIGPFIYLTLDAPDRSASKIRSLKGQLDVHPITVEKIVVPNLKSQLGKTSQTRVID